MIKPNNLPSDDDLPTEWSARSTDLLVEKTEGDGYVDYRFRTPTIPIPPFEWWLSNEWKHWWRVAVSTDQRKGRSRKWVSLIGFD